MKKEKQKKGETNEINVKLQKIMKQRGITGYQIEKATGVYAATLEKAFKLQGSWKAAINLMKICEYLGIDMKELVPGKTLDVPKEKRDMMEIMAQRITELTEKLKKKEDEIARIKKILGGR